MRKIILLVLFSVAVLLSANPMVERAIQQFWFDDSGDLMLQFGNECLSMAGFDFTISDGVNTITVAVYNIRGERIHQQVLGSGQRQLSWDGRDLSGRQMPTGVYFIRFSTEQSQVSSKLLLIR